MPSSFSRFLDEAELAKVRELYLESLDALDDDEDDEATAATDRNGPVGQDAAGRGERAGSDETD
ncbi:hypothetical protein GA0070616_0503 [Micromonospora nigra]|uniref:Uncharacterized protein n=1 Tax=Micromonospora nigra TaxID=145857 RepID=A0A1C6RCE2_9ACTN|nr:hypothetical protein [Micromonospora nigra]SCL14652.1 hypothetical protein GA0070616_0503 [Micromonospora nigra]